MVHKPKYMCDVFLTSRCCMDIEIILLQMDEFELQNDAWTVHLYSLKHIVLNGKKS